MSLEYVANSFRQWWWQWQGVAFCKALKKKISVVQRIFIQFSLQNMKNGIRKVLKFFWIASIVLEIDQVKAAYVENNAGLDITNNWDFQIAHQGHGVFADHASIPLQL
jgi:hypothetical protein